MRRGAITMVCGTRPELIKLAPLIRRFGDDAAVVYTGQHYDRSMYSRIRQDIAEPGSFVELGLGGGRRGGQLGNAVAALDAHFAAEPPDVVIVQGDTTSALAGALAANANDVPLVHVEAGLRSYDRAMPEEHNRVAIDHLADLCCAPTSVNFANLVAEGIATDRITVTGNTVVESLEEALPSHDDSRELITGHGLQADSYVLATIHRPENVDCRENLGTILGELVQLPLPVVLPLHPRTAKQVAAFGLGRLLTGLHVLEPQSYKDFLSLARWAAVLVSDSGGVQEEVSVLKRPVVVVRRSTERPEIEGTFGTLVPPGPRVRAEVLKWLDDVSGHRTRLAGIASPYGTGSPSGLIEAAVRRMISDTRFASPTLEFQLVTEG